MRDLASHRIVMSIEDGFVPGGYGTHLRYHLETVNGWDSARFRELGIPVSYIAQGKADDILASVGLDAEGIANLVTRSLADV